MREDVRKAVERVANGASETDTIHALLGEVKFGDPGELERLYGGQFDASGKLDFAARSDDELDNVPAFVRQRLAHHGYTHFRTDGNIHIYKHPEGHVTHITTDGTNFHWAHSSNGTQTHHQHRTMSAQDLVQHLDRIHA